ncbi:MAG: glycosyltransferase family 39 protein [Byssovorax sp.]
MTRRVAREGGSSSGGGAVGAGQVAIALLDEIPGDLVLEAAMLLSPHRPPQDAEGLPLASPREEQVARAVALLAALWFGLAAAWEMFGPLLAGHYASSASVGIIAENMLRWHIAGPVWEYGTAPPPPSAYYCHHPWGIFWTTAALMKVLGRHDYLCRLAPVLLSAATPVLLYRLGRAIWRPIAGAVAAASFVVLPITLAFANFNALEVPVIAWSLLGLFGQVRLAQTGRRRYLWVFLIGAFMALDSDWPAFVLFGGLLGFNLLRGYVLRPFFGPLRGERRFAESWALGVALTALTLGLYLYLFQKSGKLDDLAGSYGMRSAGNKIAFSQVLAQRRYWIELCFTPVALSVGALGTGVAALRLLALRREHEVLPLLWFLMAAVQYVVFKQGADIHVFWPHYFAGSFALAMGALAATLAALGERLSRRAGRAISPRPAFVALAVCLLPLALVARDGIPALRYARETGGRFNEKGLLIHSDGDKAAFLRWSLPAMTGRGPVELHEGMKPDWSQTWSLGGRPVQGSRPIPQRGRAADPYLADTRFLLDELQGDLAKNFHVTAVGPFWRVLPRENAAPIDAFTFVEREPSWWEWYFLSGTEPHREIVADPYATWELRVHFDQRASVPVEPPVTLEQRRIAHNIAIFQGDEERARALRAEIEKELSPLRARYDDGTALLGTTFRDGACPLLTVLIEAGGPTSADVHLTVRSRVIARAPLSFTMSDPTDREVGLPLSIAPKRWKKGFIYSDPVQIRKRPGTEVYRAVMWVRGKGAAPKLVEGGGAEGVELVRLK